MFMQVLGAKPLESASHLKTNQLAKTMIEYLKAPDDVLEVYISHLALLVCSLGLLLHVHLRFRLADFYGK